MKKAEDMAHDELVAEVCKLRNLIAYGCDGTILFNNSIPDCQRVRFDPYTEDRVKLIDEAENIRDAEFGKG